MNTTSPAVEKYFANLPTGQREALEKIRRMVKDSLPAWQEEIKTGIPAIRYRGKTVVGLGAFRDHVGLYVMYGQWLKILKDELAGYDVSNTVIRFTPNKPLPADLVRKVVSIRVAEIEGRSPANR